MSALFSHILHVLSQYITIPSPPSFFRTDNGMSSSRVSSPNISEPDNTTANGKPRPASLIYSTRWKESTLGLDTAADTGRPWSLKGSVVAPQISCPPVPATVIIPNSRSVQEIHQEQESPTGTRDPCSDPDTSINSSFNISLISDTSTCASEDDELPELSLFLTDDIFTPILHHRSRFESASSDNDSLLSPHHSPEPIRSRIPTLVKSGLGFSGLSKKGGSEGSFDGLGLVGVRNSGRVWRSEVESIEEVDEEEEEEWEASNVSQTFLREAVYTWLDDPSHSHALAPIPEGDCEGELEAPLLSDALVESPETTLLDLGNDVQQHESGVASSSPPAVHSSVLSKRPVHSTETVINPQPNHTMQSPKRRVTLSRDLSAATISSGLKRSPPRSGHSATSSPSPSPSSSTINLSPSPSRIPTRRSSSSLSPVRRFPTSSSSSSLSSIRRPLTPIPGGRPGARSTTPVLGSSKLHPLSTLGTNKSRPTTPVGSISGPRTAGEPGVRRSQSLGFESAKRTGERGWRV